MLPFYTKILYMITGNGVEFALVYPGEKMIFPRVVHILTHYPMYWHKHWLRVWVQSVSVKHNVAKQETQDFNPKFSGQLSQLTICSCHVL